MARSPWRERRTVPGGGGVELMVHDTGPDGDRPVVLAHGMSWDHTQFDDLASVLVDRGRRVVAYDARGTGASTRPLVDPDDHLLACHVVECPAIIAAVEGPPPVIGGVSMGAAVTLEVARAAEAGTIAGVVQIAPGVGPEGPAPETLGYLGWVGGALRAGGWSGLVDVIRRSGQPPADIAEQIAFAHQWEHRFDADTLAALFDGFCASARIQRGPVVSHLLPAAVVAWPDDALHPLSFAELAVEVLGSAAELVCVGPPDAGELPPGPVADVVERLLQRIS